MTLDAKSVSMQSVCTENQSNVFVQLILCLTVNTIKTTIACAFCQLPEREDADTPARPAKCNPSFLDSDSVRGSS